ncbi:MAG: PAS domain S-box protein [Peptococcaceae bacterium]|nr:PAS domain S-box protein [Peptococcaceae bacterium]
MGNESGTCNKKAKAVYENIDSSTFTSSYVPQGLVCHEIIFDDRGNPINYKIISVNKDFEDKTGLKKEDLLEKTILDIVPGMNRQWIEVFAKVAMTGEPYHCQGYCENLDKYISIFAYSSIKGQFNILFTDISDKKINDGQCPESEDKYHLLVENCHDIIYTFDRNMIIRYISSAVECLLGYSVSMVTDMPVHSFLHPDDIKSAWEAVDEMTVSGKVKRNIEMRVKHSDGTWRWYSANISFTDCEAGNRPIFQGVARDITERKNAERAIFIEKEKFKATLLSVGDGVIATDTNGDILIMNESAESLTGWCKEDAVGSFIGRIIKMINIGTGDNNDCCLQKVLESSSLVNFSSDCVLISKAGKKLAIEGNASPIWDQEGNISGVVIVMRDSTEKKKKQAEIEYLSFYDQLTGVYNRRFFEEELKRRNVEVNLPLSIAILDVNGLKLANDAFGHSQGDKILKDVTKAIIAESRTDDIVARIGGDEFVILLPKTSHNQTQIIIDRMRKAIVKEKVNDINLSVSFGWATKTEISQELQKILLEAEDNMYACKLSESPGIKHKTIKVLMKTLYERSRSEEYHSRCVSQLCEKMGIAMGLTQASTNELKLLGLMHDIGKIAVSEDILNKPEQLNHPEWLQIRRHSETGYRILSSVNEFSLIAEYVLAHHERWDGRGYPKRLSGNNIPVQARILSVIDAYAAMTGICTYQKAINKDAAVEEIKNKAGTQFDPDIARIFVEGVLNGIWE